MIDILIIHEVEDYLAWKAIFEQAGVKTPEFNYLNLPESGEL